MVFLMKKFTLSNLKVFVDPDKSNMVCKLHKALYGLKKAPRDWYKILHNYLLKIGFQRTNDNNSLYIKEGLDKKIVLEKIFVDDTLFIGGDDLCKAFSKEMSKEFEMSMFGEINK